MLPRVGRLRILVPASCPAAPTSGPPVRLQATLQALQAPHRAPALPLAPKRGHSSGLSLHSSLYMRSQAFFKAPTFTPPVLTSPSSGPCQLRHSAPTEASCVCSTRAPFPRAAHPSGLYVYVLPLTRLQTSESSLILPSPTPPHRSSLPRQPLTPHAALS